MTPDDPSLLSQQMLATHAGDLRAAGGVRHVELQDGPERGLRVLEFRTAAGLAFDVVVDRAMDIGEATWRGVSFGWQSATGYRHPALHENADEHGFAWMRSFTGLMVTAGLDHTLAPAAVDASHYRYPHKPRISQPLHGRVANIPARLTGYGERWDDDGSCVLWCEGEVRQAAVFGEHLRLRRRIEAPLVGREIRLTDVVTNHGSDPTPHKLLYHLDFGWPLLDAGSRFGIPAGRTLWRTASAEGGADNVTVPGPVAGFVEQVYEHEAVPDDDGLVRASLRNDRLGFGVEVVLDPSQFPYLFQWMHLREGAYSAGFEPSTHHMAGTEAAAAAPAAITLAQGESRRYDTVLRVID